MKRNAAYYNYVIIYPSVLLSSLTPIMFLTPPSCHDRNSYGKSFLKISLSFVESQRTHDSVFWVCSIPQIPKFPLSVNSLCSKHGSRSPLHLVDQRQAGLEVVQTLSPIFYAVIGTTSGVASAGSLIHPGFAPLYFQVTVRLTQLQSSPRKTQ